MAQSINAALGSPMARAQDAVTVSVQAPVDPNQRVAFLSVVENIEVDPGDAAAKVVINSRTGTVVIGRDRKSVVSGKSVSGSVDLGGRRSVKKKQKRHIKRRSN